MDNCEPNHDRWPVITTTRLIRDHIPANSGLLHLAIAVEDEAFLAALDEMVPRSTPLDIEYRRAQVIPAGTPVQLLDVTIRENAGELVVMAHIKAPNLDGDMTTTWVPATSLNIGIGLHFGSVTCG